MTDQEKELTALLVYIPKDLKRALKAKAAQEGITIKTAVIETINKYVNGKDGTGFQITRLD